MVARHDRIVCTPPKERNFYWNFDSISYFYVKKYFQIPAAFATAMLTPKPWAATKKSKGAPGVARTAPTPTPASVAEFFLNASA
jgi:hypothetical protein